MFPFLVPPSHPAVFVFPQNWVPPRQLEQGLCARLYVLTEPNIADSCLWPPALAAVQIAVKIIIII